MGPLDRRSFGLLGLGALAGCASAPVAAPRRTRLSTPSVAPTVPPVVPTWRPGPGEISPAAKIAAVRHVVRANDGRGRAVRVIDAQYGGLLQDAASVLVVTRLVTTDAESGWRGHTFDVRLVRTVRGWRVTAVHPSHPGPPRPLTGLEREVTAAPRIRLPPAALADVRSGMVHPSVLEALVRVSRTFGVDVSVVRSGHPTYVFGTSRLSDHPRGRAVDTWAIDGHPVVSPRTPRSLVTEYMHALAEAGSYNVGGPYLLGTAPQWFSDATHHDHVHAGFAA